jgi:hypothetical protein
MAFLGKLYADHSAQVKMLFRSFHSPPQDKKEKSRETGKSGDACKNFPA